MSYISLVQKFQLRPIRTREAHATAIEILLDLSRSGDDKIQDEEADYMIVLSKLIADYEADLLQANAEVSPSQALLFLMEQNNLRAVDLTHLVGKTHLSAFLSGMRKLSKQEAVRLGAHFSVDPHLFLEKLVPLQLQNDRATSLKVNERSETSSGLGLNRAQASKNADKKVKTGDEHSPRAKSRKRTK